ncbi:DNA-binding response regulator [Alsobacter soli]|uniref:Regulatory protein VirG n=1 Tax=Alsobacter soli TaxID=2109933 RepID=A0A2T1HUR2_9HYPH|nr:response regulator [Alsobacter soli]PSC05387.1 DNA-binding response regulator [Alsobacter soli]
MRNTATRQTHILAVDDDPGVLLMLSRYFTDEGYRVSTAESGDELRDRMRREEPDIVLMDLMLPGEDGLQLARDIRAHSDVGIIMITGRSDVVDRIVGLEIGADDYIAKPFNLRELHARIKTVLRRLRPNHDAPEPKQAENLICFEGWRLSAERRELRDPAGREVPLTTGEFDLLLALAQRPGRVIDRDTLMDLTRGRGREAFDRTIDAQVARLRKKIETAPHKPTLIKSVRGVGYVFTGQVSRG